MSRSMENTRGGKGKKRSQLSASLLSQQAQLPPIIPVTSIQPPTITQPQPIPQSQRIPTQSTSEAPHMHASPTTQLPSHVHASPPTPGTSSSHCGRAINDDREEIRPLADGFYPHSTIAGITSCIRKTLKEEKPSWKKLTEESRDAVWEEFKKMYCWNPCYNDLIRRNFEKRASGKYSQISQSLRKKGRKPEWVGDAMWKELQEYWQSPQFKAKSTQNKQNRESSAGASLHTGGSIPHSLIYEKMKTESGVEPSFSDFYFRTHRKKDQSWVGEKAESVYENFKKKKEELLSQSSSGDTTDPSQQSVPLPSDLRIFAESVGGKKKGRVFGLGSLGRVSYFAHSSTLSHPPLPEDYETIRAQVHQLNASLQKERQEKEELRFQLEETNKNVQALMQHLGFSGSSSRVQPPTQPIGDSETSNDGDDDEDEGADGNDV